MTGLVVASVVATTGAGASAPGEDAVRDRWTELERLGAGAASSPRFSVHACVMPSSAVVSSATPPGREALDETSGGVDVVTNGGAERDVRMGAVRGSTRIARGSSKEDGLDSAVPETS